MLSLVFGCLLQSVPALFNGNCPTPPLKEALRVARKIRSSEDDLNSKETINKYLQEKWLRKPEIERNAIVPPVKITPKQIQDFRCVFRDLEMIECKKTKMPTPTVVVILGGNYPGMKERVSFAKTLARSLAQKPQVILLTGDRDLEKTHPDGIKPLDDGAPEILKTEEDVGNHLVDNNPDFSMILLNSPKQPGAKRATTGDNAKALQSWLIQNKIKGRVILISIEPHGPYQLSAIKKNCQVEGVSFDVRAVPLSGPFDKKMIAICMDALARMVFTEIK